MNNLNLYLADYVKDHKTVAVVDEKRIKEAVKTILETVDAVNSCRQFDTVVGGTRLSEMFLPTWTKDMIFPVKVSILPGFDYPDLIYRPDCPQDYVYDEAKVRAAAHFLAGTQKIKPEFSTAENLRGSEAVLSNVRFAVKEMTEQNSDADVFLPVPMVNALGTVLGEDWSNVRVERMVRMYFLRTFSL